MRVSIGKSRKDIDWKVKDISWPDLCKRLASPKITSETTAEYKAMTKAERAEVKDIGGFVGGVVEGGRRRMQNVKVRSLITLDADYADTSFADTAPLISEWAMCIYSTHSHTPKAPRLRVLLPLNREVSADEYEPIARFVAKDLGIDMFDVTTYEVNRLMYWPSVSSDGESVFVQVEGDAVDADAVLARYEDWRDTREWPTSSFEATVHSKAAKAQGAPEDKPGLIGVFNRTYDIPAAIEAFLSDVYEPCADQNRYTYTLGSSTGGVVLYDNNAFAYSHHATDPAGGKLCNAFDLVRLHLFGDLDADVDSSTPANKFPSYLKMLDFVRNDGACKRLSISESQDQAKAVFEAEPYEDEDDDWVDELELDCKGNVQATVNNLLAILEHDPHLKGRLAHNEFTDRLCITGDMPWRKCDDKVNGSPWVDWDEAALRHYIETTYGIYANTKLADARDTCMLRHAFHPIRSWLDSLEWDGVPRGEELFITALGAEDIRYTRAVTRKWLTGAVARIYRPGVKFDNMIVLVGAQGIGKSYLGSQLGGAWFSDTFSTVQGKEAYEQLKGVWILEMGELSAMKRAEVESVKLFISKQEDTYRAAYGRFSKSNKRQCVFYGTTNTDDFLSDTTGNRRFWPIQCGVTDTMEVFSLTADYFMQVWAEAVNWFKNRETLFLDREVAELAKETQEEYTVEDPRVAEIAAYLEQPLPLNWESMEKSDRRNYIQGFIKLEPGAPTMKRMKVSGPEIGYELYGNESLKPWESRDITRIIARIPGWKRGKVQRGVCGQSRVYIRTDKS